MRYDGGTGNGCSHLADTQGQKVGNGLGANCTALIFIINIIIFWPVQSMFLCSVRAVITEIIMIVCFCVFLIINSLICVHVGSCKSLGLEKSKHALSEF